MSLIKIQDDDNLEYVMMETKSSCESTKLYVTKNLIEGRDNNKAKRFKKKKERTIQHTTGHNLKVSKSIV